MLSDRKTTVNYAVDLLRAHQLRRENAFLHEEVQACRKEIVAMHEELRDMRSTVQDCHAVSAEACSLSERYKVRADEHARELDLLKEVYQSTKVEIEALKTADNWSDNDAQAQLALLKKEVRRARLDCQSIEKAHNKQYGDLEASVAALQVLVDEKADMALIESLRNRVDGLPLLTANPGHAARSASRLPDSFQRANGVQILDSQPARRREDTSRSQSPDLPRVAVPKTANATILSDLDLDANAETISYAGHQYHVGEVDSLRFLPLPEPRVQASELAKINALKQKRFQDWAEYYSVGQNLMTILPDTFEETVVRRFVEGIFLEAHRRQCQQWLDSRGWTWDSLTSFNDMLSQTPRHMEPSSDSNREIGSLYAEKMAQIVKEREETEGKTKKRAPNRHLNAAREPPRRSQRLIEKETQIAHTAHVSLSNEPQPRKRATKRKRNEEELKVQQPVCNTAGDNAEMSNVAAHAHGAMDLQQAHAQAQTHIPEQPIHTQPLGPVADEGGGHDPQLATPTSIVPRLTKHPLQRNSSRPKKHASDNSQRHDHPLPQLVPQKRPVRETAEDSSDDAGYVYKRIRAKGSTSAEQTRMKRKQERRLPLPPPPEIPILPTSSDE
ncbi:hypothetical protein LTS07_006300 [Exophiala sideris]|uniref:Uncharacterized protein n=1 Tax=Exophiala sideris TaxID=1016849 RepID=A0ABR0J6W6_9EURO|nr:hypothetical protein LTS07_006300 [Exophiala sideris]KAK5057423.1 hypothetical protein LTR69_007464 [Exophiala sideris]